MAFVSTQRFYAVLAVALGFLVLMGGSASAAGEYKSPEPHDWSFEGPFGTFDRAQLQRGFRVYEQVCATCHGLQYLHFRNLGEPGGPFYNADNPNPNENSVIRAIAARFIIVDGPDDTGEMFERPGLPADRFPNPYANEQQARSVNNGAYPPDLSVITKARAGGPDYIRSLLLGYNQEPPEDLEIRPGNYYNPYMSGQILAMAPQLSPGLVEYTDGTEATEAQMAEDVTAFLAWAADPHMERRKRMGFMVMAYLVVLTGLVWFAYRRVWSNVH